MLRKVSAGASLLKLHMHAECVQVRVTDVQKQNGQILHFVSSAIEEGLEVEVKLDWDRRFDHMQVHSGAPNNHTSAMLSS